MNWTPEQNQAINEVGENIIVSAGAGSGKTAVLSERVIKRINDGVNIDSMLILTFTNLAAQEMKNRIRKKLKKNNLQEQLNLLDNSYITTFDSYSLSLVKKYHYLLNVKKNINIIDENILNIKINELLDEVLEEEYQNQEEMFCTLINDLCNKDDNLIRNAILSLNSHLNMKYNKEDYLNNYDEEYFKDNIIDEHIQEYLNIINNKKEDINKLLTDLSNYVDINYYHKIADVILPIVNSNSYDSLKLLLVDSKLPNLPKGIEEDGKLIKSNIKSLIDELKKLTKYPSELYLKESVLKTRNYVLELINIIKKLDKKINDYKYQYDLYDFNDISRMAINLLIDNPDIANELKNNFKEIMVDEYQDTNDLQEYFIQMISNHNLYMVGDIKQSIYRFRNANPAIFRNKYNDYANGFNGIKIDLLDNFRSREEVLNNVNLIFDILMDDYIGGANYVKEHRMIYGNKDYSTLGNTNQNYNMEIYNYDPESYENYNKEEIEAFIIADDIINKVKNHYQIYDKDEKILRDVCYSDFSILIDRTTNFDLYKKIFLYKHIPLSIYRDEYLTNSELLSVIKNIFTLLSNYHSDNLVSIKYSLMSIGRSFLMNMNDDQLFSIINNNPKNNIIIDKLKTIMDNINSKSLSNILDEIIKEFNIYEHIKEIGNLDDNYLKIDYLYNLCDSLNSMGYSYLDFANYMDNIFTNNTDIRFSLNKEVNDSVKIMTIHKSKGLEYHICYFPGLTPKFNEADLKEKFIYDNYLGIIAPFFDNGMDNTFYRELFKDSYNLEETSEKIRLFYVALTRVKEKMIFVLPIKEDIELYDHDVLDNNLRLSFNSFSDIINHMLSRLKDYIVNINNISLSKDYNNYDKKDIFGQFKITDQKINTFDYHINESNIIEEKHYSKENNKLIDQELKEKLDFGTKAHYYLETLDFFNPDFSKMDNFMKNKIQLFLESELLKEKDKANIYKEYEFIYEVDHIKSHGIIDLLMEYPDHLDIIDYKLKNIDDDNYNKQLNGYREYISSLTGKKVNCYLYSLMDNNYKEVKF